MRFKVKKYTIGRWKVLKSNNEPILTKPLAQTWSTLYFLWWDMFMTGTCCKNTPPFSCPTTFSIRWRKNWSTEFEICGGTDCIVCARLKIVNMFSQAFGHGWNSFMVVRYTFSSQQLGSNFWTEKFLSYIKPKEWDHVMTTGPRGSYAENGCAWNQKRSQQGPWCVFHVFARHTFLK